MNTTYDVDYFIAKFEAIPEKEWCVGDYEVNGAYCAEGHCGGSWRVIPTPPEVRALVDILGSPPSKINDGGHLYYQQPTPKQRILAALHDVKTKMIAGHD